MDPHEVNNPKIQHIINTFLVFFFINSGAALHTKFLRGHERRNLPHKRNVEAKVFTTRPISCFGKI